MQEMNGCFQLGFMQLAVAGDPAVPPTSSAAETAATTTAATTRAALIITPQAESSSPSPQPLLQGEIYRSSGPSSSSPPITRDTLVSIKLAVTAATAAAAASTRAGAGGGALRGDL